MKKTVALLLCTISILLFCGCNFNAPLKNKMLDYYTQDSNYVQVTGIIKTVEYHKETDELHIGIELLTDNHLFPYLDDASCGEFTIVNWSLFEFDLEIDDAIVFISAPYYFYNGHIWPIVAVEKEDFEYLSYKKGKDNYLNWIRETLD